MRYKYSLDKSRHKYLYEFTSDNPDVGCDLADEAASDYHYRHNGYESVWPLEFRLYDTNDKVLGTFLVEREVSPVFRSQKI